MIAKKEEGKSIERLKSEPSKDIIQTKKDKFIKNKRL